MYSETEENRFLEVTYANGDKEVLYFKDFNSGAMIQNIVDRGKKMAIKEFLTSGKQGPAPAAPARRAASTSSARTRTCPTPPTPTTGPASPARRASGSSTSARSSPAARAPRPAAPSRRPATPASTCKRASATGAGAQAAAPARVALATAALSATGARRSRTRARLARRPARVRRPRRRRRSTSARSCSAPNGTWRSSGIIDLGKYGVLLFFLVSGYVIPMSLERHGSLRRFWIGRLFRIYPAYLAADRRCSSVLARPGCCRCRLAARRDASAASWRTRRCCPTCSACAASVRVVLDPVVRDDRSIWWWPGCSRGGCTGTAPGGRPGSRLAALLAGPAAAGRPAGATAGDRRRHRRRCCWSLVGRRASPAYVSRRWSRPAGAVGIGFVLLPAVNGHATRGDSTRRLVLAGPAAARRDVRRHGRLPGAARPDRPRRAAAASVLALGVIGAHGHVWRSRSGCALDRRRSRAVAATFAVAFAAAAPRRARGADLARHDQLLAVSAARDRADRWRRSSRSRRRGRCDPVGVGLTSSPSCSGSPGSRTDGGTARPGIGRRLAASTATVRPTMDSVPRRARAAARTQRESV